MFTLCSLVFFVALFSLCNAQNVSIEESEMREWLKLLRFAGTIKSYKGWDVDTPVCNWTGVTCDSAENITSIVVGPTRHFAIVYGELPDLLRWEDLKNRNLAFTSLTYIFFTQFRFGPYLPDYVDRMWSNGNNSNPNTPWNLVIENNFSPSLLCPLSPPFDQFLVARARSIGCSKINIIDIQPSYGPKSGGTDVWLKVNVALGFLNLFCSFGHEDGFTVPVPVTQLYFLDYRFKDADNFTDTLEYSTSIIKCTSPPHPAGPVDVRIYAQLSTSPDLIKLTTDPWKTIFNYECPAGTVATIVNGSVTCPQCPPGQWSPKASPQCFNCSAGTYSDDLGSASCTPCPPGTYSNRTRQSSSDTCLPCEPGSYSNKNASSRCTLCSPGSAQPLSGKTECKACPPGSIAQGPGNANCTLCPAGTYSKPGIQGGCVSCPIGTFSVVNGSSECKSCKPGETTSAPGSPTCDVICQPGSFRSADVQRCIECPAGKFSNSTGLVVCQLCPVLTYNPYSNRTNCTPCPPGQINSNRGSISCIQKVVPPAPQDNAGLVIGIVLLILVLIGIIIAVIYIIKKKGEHDKKRNEIEEIRKIMDGVNNY